MIHRANSGDWSRSYGYGTTDNRLQSTTVGQTTVNYAHNVHGSMTSMPHLQSMDWDFAERLSHVTRGSGSGSTEAYYNYDGSGQRIRKMVVKGNITEERLYLGGFEIYRKTVGGVLDLERETLHVMDDKKRIALVETLTVENGSPVANLTVVQRYQLDNHLGSASLELDETANVVSYEEYYPYGDTSYQAGRSASEVSQKRYRYTGKEKDEESGLYYHGARYYACWLGRWTASDPIGLQGGINLYAYVSGNPVRLNDPKGTSENEFNSTQVTTNPDGSQSIHVMRGRASGFFAPEASAVQTPNPSNTPSGPQLIQGPGPGFRERLDKEGGPIAFLFKIGYDIADDAYIVAQKVAGSGNETTRLSGEFVSDRDAQDALVNTSMLFVFSGGKATGKMAEGLADDAVKTMSKESSHSVPLKLGNEPIDDMANSLNESAQRIMNEEKARSFYKQAGWNDSRIDSHISGIDFSKPVDIVTVEKGSEFVLYGFPGDPVGNYFALPETPAYGLGIYTNGRIATPYISMESTTALKSTAATVVDSWSVPGLDIVAPGNGTQFFIPQKNLMKAHP